VAVVFPFVTSEGVLSYIIPALIWGIACIGWTAIFRTGQFSMGQAGFMAIGGYVTGILTATPPWTSGITSATVHLPVLVGMLIGGLAAAVLAFIVGFITLRLAGIFFCIVTLAFGELVNVNTLNLPKVFGGINGMPAPDPQLFGLDFKSTRVPYYFLVLAAVIITSIVFWRLDRSRLGMLFRSVSSNRNLAAHTGINLMKYRVIAFTVAGFFAGLSGALFAHYLRVTTPTLFTFSESVLILIMCVVGGTRSAVAGSLVGALALSPAGDYLTSKLQGAKPLVFGVIVVLVAFFLTNGVTSIPEMVKNFAVGRVQARK